MALLLAFAACGALGALQVLASASAEGRRPGGPAGAAGPSLQIVSPRATEIVSGERAIEVVLPAQARPGDHARIQISVDGAVVATLERPPYRTVHDFGESLGARRISARITSGPGAGLAAEITTRGFDPRRVDAVARVNLVTLYVSVRGPGGRYVNGLARDSFLIYEGDRRQKISSFEIERRPLVAAIVLDTSFSMKGEPIAAAQDAAARFVRSLEPQDRVMVVSFADRPNVLADLTPDRDKAIAAISSVEAKGGTALYDAIYTVSDRLASEEGRRVIILLSDGRDEAQNGLEPGSLHVFEEALEKALRSEVILFTIGFGRKLETETDFYGRTTLKEILDRLALDSGGSSHYPQRPSQLKSAYELIGEELRNQYSLAYSPQPFLADGQWHTLRVEMKDPSLKALTRRGYYAPKG